MAGDLRSILGRFRSEARSEREKGEYFERLVAAYLRHDAVQATQYSNVQTFAEWAAEHGYDARDDGIDLVATLADDSGVCAVQCKFYSDGKRVEKSDIDSFFTASGRERIVRRLIVDTSDGNWSEAAEKALALQTIPTQRIGLADLEASNVEWATFVATGEVRTGVPKSPRPHQRDALQAVRDGLAKADRGKLVMACGTGKTFTSLRIAEELVGPGGTVLFMVPSLALMSQAVREWTEDASVPLRSFAACSDARVGKQQGREDTADIAVHDLAYPATTDGAKLAEQMASVAAEAMTVVFATYQSINVLTDAQARGVGVFELIVCDEAHRTTGAKVDGQDDSNFVRIHDDANVRGAKRLYMTATPRIYGEAVTRKAAENSVELVAMDDASIYGETLFERGFSWAVENDLLTDYKVIVLAVDEDKVARSVQRRLSSENELKIDDATKIVGCFKALAKVGLGTDVGGDTEPARRALAFCKDIRSSKLVTAEFASVVEEYVEQDQDDEDVPELSCEVRHVDGTFNADQRTRLLSWLKSDGAEDECRILSNARCLSEGVDVPALDAIMFLHPRKSQIDVVQSVGRVMRRAPGKRMGYVILPVGIPADQTPEQALGQNERYRVVWQILNALRAHDDRLDGTINQMGLGQDVSHRIEIVAEANEMPGQRAEPSRSMGIGSGTSDEDTGAMGGEERTRGGNGHVGDLFVDEFAAAVRARIVKKCGTRDYWEDWAKDIADIARRHIQRIEALIEGGDGAVRATFDAFLAELRDDLNDAIQPADAIEMLAQHVITRPVFEALFEGNRFVAENPVSRAMQGILEKIDEARIDKEAESLARFYDSVRRRADGLTDPAAKQRLIVELYDKFFRTAFPRTTQRMGVVYTPVEIVDFILRSVDETLRREFGETLGSQNVHVIDPFTGTGTFVTRLLQSGLIERSDLERKYRSEIHANEIILLAYYIAAINIETVFAGLVGGDRYEPFEGILLTDTFQMYERGDMIANVLEDNSARRERQRALDIKVIVGNPPYVVGDDDANSDQAAADYPELDERIRATYAARTDATNLNGLYNSYLRAIRWASERLGKDGGVVAFVTNGGFLDGNASAGVRRCLVDEFSDLRIFDLKGNQRTSGERSRREGGKVFDAGSRAPIAISVLTKNPDRPAAGAIHYHDIGDYLSRDDKLTIIRQFGSVGGIQAAEGWTRIVPDSHGDWLNQRDTSFGEHIRIGDKTRGAAPALFATYSNGVKTQRDPWAVNASREALERNIRRLIDNYRMSVERIREVGAEGEQAKRLRVNDPREIAWTAGLVTSAARGDVLEVDFDRIAVATYRPFTPQMLYYDARLNERRYLTPSFFPTPEHRTRTICVSGAGHKGQFSALMVDRVPALHTADMAGSQCFPHTYYDRPKPADTDAPDMLDEAEPELTERDGITDEGLAHVRAAYLGHAITKRDVFHYVYGLLHSPDYRARYADNLRKELPRIPAVATHADFHAFADAGAKLADLHVNFDEVEPFEVGYENGPLPTDIADREAFFRVEKMRFAGNARSPDRTRIVYNANVTLTGIPPEAYNYVVNGKPAIGHVMERQGVSTDRYNAEKRTGSGIVNDANRYAIETMGDPEYPLLLLRRVITVSLRTVEIVESLPPLRLPDEALAEAAE